MSIARTLAAFAAAGIGCGLGQAAASDLIDASLAETRLFWNVEFGHATRAPKGRAGLAIGYQGVDAPGRNVSAAEFSFSPAGPAAKIAGVPLEPRRLRMSQAEEAVDQIEAPRPWYLRQWVLWTGAALVATAALANGFEDSLEESLKPDDPEDNPEGGSGSGILCGGEVGPVDIPDECVVPIGLTTAREHLMSGRTDTRWLDAGTGQMGDLVAR